MRGRVALVTGGSGGIGAALAARLVEAGATVAVHYSENRAAAERTGAPIFQADLRDPRAPEQLVDAVEAELGPIDVLAANAGLSRPAGYDDVDAAAFDETLAVNLRAPFLLARRVLPGMRERRFGRILFTSSVAGLTGGIIGPHYAASKSGLHGLTHHLATRVAADGVTVNAIAPALIEDTGMLPGDPGELAKRVPVQRLGTPGEVADLMLAILSNGYVTNQVISIDGGMHPG
jgi:3-oxoacyl-[acyl-carrier protein] reductase